MSSGTSSNSNGKEFLPGGSDQEPFTEDFKTTNDRRGGVTKKSSAVSSSSSNAVIKDFKNSDHGQQSMGLGLADGSGLQDHAEKLASNLALQDMKAAVGLHAGGTLDSMLNKARKVATINQTGEGTVSEGGDTTNSVGLNSFGINRAESLSTEEAIRAAKRRELLAYGQKDAFSASSYKVANVAVDEKSDHLHLKVDDMCPSQKRLSVAISQVGGDIHTRQRLEDLNLSANKMGLLNPLEHDPDNGKY